jgi:hypothetical protein
VPTNRPPQRAIAICAALTIALGLAACGSSSTPPPTTTTTTLPSVAASTAAIKHAYSVLFDLANAAVAPKLVVIQDGSTLRAVMTSMLRTSLAKQAAGATVSKVTIEHGAACKNEILPSPCATVTYSIFSPTHSVLLPASGGLAVYQHAKWLVAKVTICGLISLGSPGGKEPAACSA